jgi:hypothetical protein
VGRLRAPLRLTGSRRYYYLVIPLERRTASIAGRSSASDWGGGGTRLARKIRSRAGAGAMTRLGYVYGNLMVNVSRRNEKLIQRVVGILERATGADQETARRTLEASSNRTPVAVAMLAAGVSRARAAAALKKSRGHMRQAIAIANPK